MLFLTNDDVHQVLTIERCMEAVEDCTRELALGHVLPQTANVVSLALSDERESFGGFDGKKSWFTLNSGGIVLDLAYRMAILRVYTSNPSIVQMYGMARRGDNDNQSAPGEFGNKHPDFLLIFDIDESRLLSMMQNRDLQTIRVGALAGLSTKYMARQDAHTVGMIGSGWIARPSLAACCLTRDITSVKVYSPNQEHREQYAKEMQARLEIEVHPVASAQEAASGVDILISATNTAEPTFDPAWLQTGTHVHCIHGWEYDERMLSKADIVAWGYPGAREHAYGANSYPEGDQEEPIVHMRRTLKWDELDKYADKRVYLTDVLTGQAEGRTGDQQITLCPSPAGGTAGISRFAITAPRVYEWAKAQGIGRELPDEWFQAQGEPRA